MAKGDAATDLEAPVAKLSIGPGNSELGASIKPVAAKPQGTNKKKTKEVADSWEDEDVSSSDDEAPAPALLTEHKTTAASTAAPPPAASSKPSYHSAPSPGGNAPSPSLSADWSRPDPGASDSGPARRPEKTDVVARRLIAGALGIRVPQTAEQKAYNKSLLEAERKKREKARAEKKQQEEDAERAKKAAWDD
ncbi:hypothetical protein F503_02970 [Ophiostoma piceae UAMH 11346]|uniref:Ubiquitin smt3 n=1 Tax=Ophiostoma piceae (strain UAMH 11346) TaxID=1262450 RepID=S3C2Z9_OPHP1|nr:hypothetical protein F503_02970 [Ophiostoma piceae UAMH 11346]